MINGSGPGLRQHHNWIESFIDVHRDFPTTPLLLKWSAISCVAGALERKVWCGPYPGMRLFANLYVVLTGPPGCGKTASLAPTEALWMKLENHHVAPTSVTKASLIDCLDKAKRSITLGLIQPDHFNALSVASGELGVLVPSYDSEFMNALTALYDGHPYTETRRTKDINITIKSPLLNILAATTPSFLNDLMPEGAWDQGFISRCILVYSADRIIKPLFGGKTSTDRTDLLTDLKAIGELYGYMRFDPSAAAAIGRWHLDGGKPYPNHPKLAHYISRRTAHVLKLCMVASVARDDELVVKVEDVETALEWLCEVEELMPHIFSTVTAGVDGPVIKETLFAIRAAYQVGSIPVSEATIYEFLALRSPSSNVKTIIEVMLKSGMIRQHHTTNGFAYSPQFMH